MTWFKVDDSMYSHPKALQAGNAALGLWMRCGSFAANHLTDGFVPRQIAELYGTPAQIRRLMDSGLWEKADGGWMMHDFGDYNPTSVQVRADRRAAADRQRRAREKAASQRDSRRDGDDAAGNRHGVTHSAVTPESRRESRSPRPDPTRPASELPLPDPSGSKVAKLKTARDRNILFDALVSAFGYDPAQLTRTQQSSLGKCAAELKDVQADEADVLARLRRYRTLHPTWEATPPALVKHWASLSPPPSSGRAVDR